MFKPKTIATIRFNNSIHAIEPLDIIARVHQLHFDAIQSILEIQIELEGISVESTRLVFEEYIGSEEFGLNVLVSNISDDVEIIDYQTTSDNVVVHAKIDKSISESFIKTIADNCKIPFYVGTLYV
jgi:hypothetical protein